MKTVRSLALPILAGLSLGSFAACGSGGTVVIDEPDSSSSGSMGSSSGSSSGGSSSGGSSSGASSSGTPDASPNRYTLGGSITGLARAGLVLQNGAETLTVEQAATTFAFASRYEAGTAYAITVATQPSGQTCTVSNGAGTLGSANVDNVQVTCVLNDYRLAGTVIGLEGSGLTLTNAGSDPLAVAPSDPPGSEVAFEFPARVQSGQSFAVTVASQPTSPSQTCAVQGGSGEVVAGDVTSVVVNCTTDTFTIGGSVSGLVNQGVTLEDQDGNEITVNDNGQFAFLAAVASGSPYAVTVKTNPGAPAQECTITNGSGIVGDANVDDVQVTCVTRSFVVRGSLTGLAGNTVQLTHGAEVLDLDADGAFAFQALIESGQPWSIAVSAQPTGPTQVCTAAPASGVIGAADAEVAVTCETSRFRLGGSVSGLVDGDVVTLQNGGESVQVAANGPFELPTVASGSGYAVTASSATKTCVVSNGAGTITNADVLDVQVSCMTTMVTVNGLDWYYKPAACGEPCNAVFAGVGKVPADDATVFEAQNTEAECRAISQALGMGNNVSMASYTYACLMDTAGVHTAPGGLLPVLLCSTYSGCPAAHRTMMDQMGVACGAGSRRSICACQ